MALIDPLVDITIASSAFSLAQFVVQRTLGQRDKVNAMQKRMQELQKEVGEIAKGVQKPGDAASQKMEQKEKEMLTLMNEIMGYSFKPMLVILPLFLLVMHFMGEWYAPFLIHLPFGLHPHEILRWPPIIGNSAYGVRGFFIVVSLFCNLWLEAIYGQLQKRKEAKNKPAKTPDAQPAA